jgi:hypothetical protein
VRISRYYKLKISVQTLLMAHAKTVALRAKGCFRIPTEDKAASGLRECNVEVRT